MSGGQREIANIPGIRSGKTNAIANENHGYSSSAGEKSFARGFNGTWKICNLRMIYLE